MKMTREEYAKRQRRAANKVRQPRMSKEQKRREKTARRKQRIDWGDTIRDWMVTMRLDGKRVTVEIRCPSPIDAVKLALWENRHYVLANVSVDRALVEVRHEHYGLVESTICEIFKVDSPHPTAKPPEPVDEKPDKRKEPLSPMREAAISILRNFSNKKREQAMKDDVDIALCRKADPDFQADELSGLPGLSLAGKEEK